MIKHDKTIVLVLSHTLLTPLFHSALELHFFVLAAKTCLEAMERRSVFHRLPSWQANEKYVAIQASPSFLIDLKLLLSADIRPI